MSVSHEPVGPAIAFVLVVGRVTQTGDGGKAMFTEVSGGRQESIVEERVWQAVIVSTIEEWMSGSLRRSLEAEQFLFRDDCDFRLVCQSAGMDAGRLAAACKVARQA